jgi:hypothetical protein
MKSEVGRIKYAGGDGGWACRIADCGWWTEGAAIGNGRPAGPWRVGLAGVWLYLVYPLQPTAPTDQTSQPAGRVFGDIFIDERAMRHEKNNDRDHAHAVGLLRYKPGYPGGFRGVPRIAGGLTGGIREACRGRVARGDKAGTLSGL